MEDNPTPEPHSRSSSPAVAFKTKMPVRAGYAWWAATELRPQPTPAPPSLRPPHPCA